MAMADRPSATDRNSGHHEEQAGLEQELEEERGEPALQLRVAQHGGIDEGRALVVHAVPLPAEEPDEDGTARRISQTTGERPSHTGASAFGRTKPHVPERSTP